MNDDRQADLLISRREVLRLLGATGAAMLTRYSSAQTRTANSTNGKLPGCILTPDQTEGPYFVDEYLNRSDIRADPADGSVTAGLPLILELRVFRISNSACTPLAGAVVDIWHCEAGVYSDAADWHFNTVGKKFLRGYQVADENGGVRFTTIYPGWYPSRTVHVHFKVRAKSTLVRRYEFTSQLYFDDAVTDRVHAQKPYSSRGQRTLKSNRDSIYRDGGSQLMLPLVAIGQSYGATFDVGSRMA
jgi:protocatechuate 3,4-dioxygenase beta subunit